MVFRVLACKFDLDLPAQYGGSAIDLALEHQNAKSWKGVAHDADKLRNVEARRKLLIYYPNQEDVHQHLGQFRENPPRAQYLKWPCESGDDVYSDECGRCN